MLGWGWVRFEWLGFSCWCCFDFDTSLVGFVMFVACGLRILFSLVGWFRGVTISLVF